MSKSQSFDPVDPRIMSYLAELWDSSPRELSVPKKMETLAAEKRFPIVGRSVGVMLELLTKLVGAKRVFEFGSGYGYSAYWFAQGLSKGGQVICTDGSQENADLAKEYLSEAGLWECIEYKVGWAQDRFKETSGEFDIVYNDVDKDAYPEVWGLAKDRIRSGGLYIADNVLWSGRVTMDPGESASTKAIQEHNHQIVSDSNFDVFLNPVRDGVIVARRKSRRI